MSYLAKNYNRKKISFKRGRGSYLFSTDGKKYLDMLSGIAVNSLGHAHPKLVKTIKDQSKKLWHVSNAFKIPEGEKLAKRIVKKTFADSIIFQNSGAEATETAIKAARRYFYSKGKKNKTRIVSNEFGIISIKKGASSLIKTYSGLGVKKSSRIKAGIKDKANIKKYINKIFLKIFSYCIIS